MNTLNVIVVANQKDFCQQFPHMIFVYMHVKCGKMVWMCKHQPPNAIYIYLLKKFLYAILIDYMQHLSIGLTVWNGNFTASAIILKDSHGKWWCTSSHYYLRRLTHTYRRRRALLLLPQQFSRFHILTVLYVDLN